jgi:hypothetical protein
MKKDKLAKNNVFYVDHTGHIGSASLLRVVDLDDFSEEAQEAFRKLPSGDIKAFMEWSYAYGVKKRHEGSITVPRGWSTVVSKENHKIIDDYVERAQFGGAEFFLYEN